MKWNAETRYKLILEINNSIAARKSREGLFKSLSKELHKHFSYDRLSINVYDHDKKAIEYFASAVGVQPGGHVNDRARSLDQSAIARIVISSGQPAIFDDLTQYSDISSIRYLVEAGLRTTLAYPLIVREKILGTLHFSYMEKPPAFTELTELLDALSRQIAIAVDNMLAYTALRQTNQHLQKEKEYLLTHSHDYQVDGFYYGSQRMKEVVETIEQVANTDETILLTGETGTGKDFLARLIHEKSHRKNHLLVKTNCPGLTTSLFESELFGHVKGSFTGADKQRLGRFELADKGTIFLDEIGELPLGLQAKLLQVLQEKRFERVGESSSTPVDARIVAATNKDLFQCVQDGEFRQDLFYRLDTLTIKVPALRERAEDIPILLKSITASEAERMHKAPPVFTDEVFALLSGYSWPGNIRELKNMVKRLIILQPGKRVSAHDIERMFLMSTSAPGRSTQLVTRDQAEKENIIRVLKVTKGMVGGKKGAANLLDMPRSTLVYRLKKLGINPEYYRYAVVD